MGRGLPHPRPALLPPTPPTRLSSSDACTAGIELPCASGDEHHTVSPSCVFPAVDSSSILSDPPALATRFRELGYLAFSNFFSDDLTRSAANQIAIVHGRCATGPARVPADFEVNLSSGASWSECWRSLGADPTFARLSESATLFELATTLSAALGYSGTPTLLPQFTFVRGKGSGAGTTPHVDFRTSETTAAGLDKSQPGFICWASLRVPSTPAKTSELCFSPCSHRHQPPAALDTKDGGKLDVLPPDFRAQMEAGEVQWHVLNQDSGLAGAGTLVLMDLRLVHGATIGEIADGGVDDLAAAGSAAGVDAHYRYSWDTRFVCGSGAPFSAES